MVYITYLCNSYISGISTPQCCPLDEIIFQLLLIWCKLILITGILKQFALEQPEKEIRVDGCLFSVTHQRNLAKEQDDTRLYQPK